MPTSYRKSIYAFIFMKDERFGSRFDWKDFRLEEKTGI